MPAYNPTCHYCGEPCTWSSSSSHIYSGRDFGPVWECRACSAYCGCHKQGKPPHRRPLGTPANRQDRELRKQAHALFDPLWPRVAQRDDISKGHARSRAYIWLAGELGIEPRDCHIGMMHGADLEKVIACCTPPFGLSNT